MKYIAKVRLLIAIACVFLLAACNSMPKSLDFSKPVEVTSLSDDAWVVDIGKALDRPSRYKLSRVEAAKEAQNRECAYFKTDSLINEQLSTFKGQRAYRCASEDSDAVLVTEEILTLENL